MAGSDYGTESRIMQAGSRVGIGAGVNPLEAYRTESGAENTQEGTGSIARKAEGTVGDVLYSFAEGVSKGAEGIVDFLANMMGGGYLADAPEWYRNIITAKEVVSLNPVGLYNLLTDGQGYDLVKDFVETDYTAKLAEIDTTREKLHVDESVLPGWGREVAQGVGQMMPAVLAAAATGGSSVIGTVGGHALTAAEAASLGTLGMSAAGNSTAQALNEGANSMRATAYGVAEGAKEIWTEMLVGGALDKLYGAGFLDPVVRRITAGGAKSPAVRRLTRIGKEFVEEGAEEFIGDFYLDRINQSIYKGADAFEGATLGGELKEAGRSFLLGGATALGFNATVGKAMAGMGHGYTGKQSDAIDVIEDIQAQQDKLKRLLREQDGVDNAAKREKTHSDLEGLYGELENLLTGMKEETRTVFIRDTGIGEWYGADGKMQQVFREGLGDWKRVDETKYTYNVKPKAVTQALERHRTSLAEGLTEEQSVAYKRLTGAWTSLAEASGDNIGFVLVDSLDAEGAEALYDRGSNVVLMSKELLGKPAQAGEATVDMAFVKTIHEALHADEGGMMAQALTAMMQDNPEAVAYAVREMSERGYTGAEGVEGEVGEMHRLLMLDEKTATEEDMKKRVMLLSEMTSFMAEHEVASADFFDHLLHTDAGTAEKLLRRIGDMVKVFRMRKDPASRAAFRRARDMQSLYMNAVEEAGYRYEAGRIVGAEEEKEETEEIRTSIKKTRNIGYLEQIELVLSKKLNGSNSLYLGDIALKIAPSMKRPFSMDQGDFRKSVREKGNNKHYSAHGVSEKVMGKLPSLLEKAVLFVLNENRITVITEEQTNDTNGNSSLIVAGIWLNQTMEGESVNLVKSVYPMDDIQKKLLRYAENGTLWATNQNDAERILATAGIKLPRDNIHIGTAEHIINENSHFVNTENEKSIRESKKPKQTDSNAFEEAVRRSGLDFDDQVMAETRDEAESRQAAQETEEARKTSSGKRYYAEVREPSVVGRVNRLGQNWVYSMEDARKIAEAVEKLLTYEVGEDAAGEKAGTAARMPMAFTRGEAGRLFTAMNDAQTAAERRAVAEETAERYLQNLMVKEVFADDAVDRAAAELEVLKKYTKGLTIGEAEADIRAIYGTEADRVLRRWRAKKGTDAPGIDAIKEALETEMGVSIDADNPADILRWMDDRYRKDKSILNTRYKAFAGETTGDYYNQVKAEITAELLKGMQEGGTITSVAELMGQLERRTQSLDRMEGYLRRKVAENDERLEVMHRARTVSYLADNFGKWKKGVFESAAGLSQKDILGKSIGELSKITNRGNLLRDWRAVRSHIDVLAKWYNTDEARTLLTKETWRQEIADMMGELAKGDKPLTAADLKNLEEVMRYMKGVVEGAGTVFRNGKRVDAKTIAEDFHELYNLQESDGTRTRLRSRRMKAMEFVIEHYGPSYFDPMTLARYYDCYDKKGFLTNIMTEIRQAELKTAVLRDRLMHDIEEFHKEHPNYANEAEKRMVHFGTLDVQVGIGLYTYLALRRTQFVPHIMAGGFTYTDEEGTKQRISGMMAVTKDTTMKDMEMWAAEFGRELYSQFTDEDKELLRIAWKLFNIDCKDLKAETDRRLYGYTNVIEGDYCPISTSDKAVKADDGTYRNEMDRVSSLSFNKATIEGARNKVNLEDLQTVLVRHINGVAKYAGMAEVVHNFQTLVNINFSGSDGDVDTLYTQLEKIWPKAKSDMINPGAVDYLKEMISDAQGIRRTTKGGLFTAATEWLRGNYAVAVLGANPKVWLTQFSSLIASTSIIEPKYLIRGLGSKGMSYKAFDAYLDESSDLARLRAKDNVAMHAQTLKDKIGKVGEKSMTLIGTFDRMVVRSVFQAARYQVEDEMGYKVGTEENTKAASELLEKVIFETQQNAASTERSRSMRSGHTWEKLITMFSADSMKLIGRVVDAVGEAAVMKETGVTGEKLAKAQKQAGRTVAVWAAVSAYMALVSVLFSKLLRREDDDSLTDWNVEDIGEYFGEMLGSLVGGLPIIKECVEGMERAFGIEAMELSSINDMMSDVRKLAQAIGNGGQTTPQTWAGIIRDTLLDGAQFLGLPAKNVEKYIRAFCSYLPGDSSYAYTSIWQNKSFTGDLASAVEAGDDDKIGTIVGVATRQAVGDVVGKNVQDEIVRLAKAGYNALPRSVGTSVTVNGEAVNLSYRQQERMRKLYAKANEDAERMLNTQSFRMASDEVKSKAITKLYDMRYKLAMEDVLGVELDNKSALFARAVEPYKLALIVSQASELEADRNTGGRVVAGTKKAKVARYIQSLKMSAGEKYLAFGYLGYSTGGDEKIVRAYIQKQRMTAAAKKRLYSYCGY